MISYKANPQAEFHKTAPNRKILHTAGNKRYVCIYVLEQGILTGPIQVNL